jgi:hypothetical protein
MAYRWCKEVAGGDSMSAVYQHPDGHEINIARSMLTVTNDAGESVSVPIGIIGLRELGECLIALSECELTAANCSEQAGNTIASALLNDLLAADNQALRGALIKAAILNLATLQHHDRAAAGFALALVNVLETGLKNLPKVTT